MIFLKTDPDSGEIIEQHHAPFDPIIGKGKTKEELEKMGMLVESLPEPILDNSKIHMLYVNQVSGELFYKYMDRPKTPEEEAEIKMKLMQDAIDDLIMGGMM